MRALGVALGVLAPRVAHAQASAEVRPFVDLALAFGANEGEADYNGPADSGVVGQPTHREEAGPFDGLSEELALSLGVGVGHAWRFGVRGGAMEIPGFSTSPGLAGESGLVALSLGGFARWYFARADAGSWLEASAGARHVHMPRVARAPGAAPAELLDEGAFDSLWGPEGGFAFGYAIDVAGPVKWGPVLRISASTAGSEHGRVGMAGATLGVEVGWL